ncbi:hypothetical protein G7046_g5884 [Stylonectria norvegica]|nr:hypothetical protein G7046_g5884 [Stylonectria norvegica]
MSTKTYLLNSPTDWDAFEQSYILKSTAERVFHLARLSDPIQFNQLRIKEPKRPEYSNYMAKVRAEGGEATPKFKRGEEPAKHHNELLAEDQEDIKAETTLYRTDLERFTKQADGIRNVLNWLIEKLAPYYIETCAPAMTGSEEHDNISLFFANLKAVCGVNDALRKKQARKAYFDVLKEGTSNKTNWREWIIKWEKAMNMAKLRKVAESLDSSTWFEDLERALDHEFKVILRIEKNQNRKEIESGSYQPATFAVKFRDELHDNEELLTKPNKSKIAKGSFGPTFQASDAKTQGGSKPQASDTKGQKRSEPSTKDSSEQRKKRQRQASDVTETCILCDSKHYGANTSNCWVAFPETMPLKFVKSEKKAEEWEQRFKTKPEVRKLYEKLKSEKGSSQEETQ